MKLNYTAARRALQDAGFSSEEIAQLMREPQEARDRAALACVNAIQMDYVAQGGMLMDNVHEIARRAYQQADALVQASQWRPQS